MARRSGITRRKKRGAPPRGKDTRIGLRLEPELLARVDWWAASQKDGPSRLETMRRLLELGACGRPPSLREEIELFPALIMQSHGDLAALALYRP
jgi:hypothetical protein